MNISVCVQHHPARAHLLPALIALLGGSPEIVVDPEPDDPLPSPLRTYVLALDRTPAEATHRLVVQDDAIPCQQFHERMLAAVSAKPEDLVALFAPGAAPHRAAILTALKHGERWARLHALWMPTVALCWPAGKAREFVAWAQDDLGQTPRGEPFRGDDGPVGRFCQLRRYDVWAIAPSLVQHPDKEPSLIGRKHRAGQNIARVAAAFID